MNNFAKTASTLEAVAEGNAVLKHIRFREDTQTFYLQTKHTAYVFCINELNEPEHLYYGASIPEEDIRHIRSRHGYSFAPYAEEERTKVVEPEVNPTGGPLNMGEVVRAVSNATRNEAVLVTDVGQNQMMSARYFRYSRNRSIITSGGLGTMGFGLPAAVGATFAVPDRTVCVFMGDGGLQMNLQELGTVMEQKAPVKMILLNNNYLGNVRQWQAMFFNRKYSFTPMLNPDYMKIAEAYGIPSRRVIERADLASAIEEMLAADGPFLLEACVIEEGNVLPMTPPGGSVNAMLLEY